MDLLHSGRFGGFCLVSSDSDFTRLAARIREQGIDVYGFGEQKTPASFRQACKRFIYTENLVPVVPRSEQGAAVPKPEKPAEASHKQPPSLAIPLIEAALAQLEDVDGWYSLAAAGTRLLALKSDFDPRTYGCAKLALLVERSQAFKLRRDGLIVHIKPKAIAGSIPSER
ncbi:NYN domain-containing protein [Roseomonas sp. SSH11]|uniref:NYN domain-containing protein n=2 Tax=Pararoseomonas baculiformis TaxID=2820812 RepID=A0ABS4AIE9_9PROT|nr:NYN domain-containing protein [Pararoseomonas baculiformis]